MDLQNLRELVKKVKSICYRANTNKNSTDSQNVLQGSGPAYISLFSKLGEAIITILRSLVSNRNS